MPGRLVHLQDTGRLWVRCVGGPLERLERRSRETCLCVEYLLQDVVRALGHVRGLPGQGGTRVGAGRIPGAGGASPVLSPRPLGGRPSLLSFPLGREASPAVPPAPGLPGFSVRGPPP